MITFLIALVIFLLWNVVAWIYFVGRLFDPDNKTYVMDYVIAGPAMVELYLYEKISNLLNK